MTWFKIDDRFNDHPKIERLEAACAGDGLLFFACRGAWEAMGIDCAARETDGRFTLARADKVLSALSKSDRDRILTLLVASSLWEEIPAVSDLRFHDWADWQPTKAELDAKRKAASSRQSRHRHAVTDGVTHGVTHAVGHASPAGARAGTGRDSENPDPDPDARESEPTDATAGRGGAGVGPVGGPDAGQRPDGAVSATSAPIAIDHWEALNALSAGGINPHLGPSDERQFLLLLKSLARQGVNIDDFVTLGRCVKAGKAVWWQGSWELRLMLGQRDAAGEVGARALIRSLLAAREWAARSSAPVAPPRKVYEPTEADRAHGVKVFDAARAALAARPNPYVAKPEAARG